MDAVRYQEGRAIVSKNAIFKRHLSISLRLVYLPHPERSERLEDPCQQLSGCVRLNNSRSKKRSRDFSLLLCSSRTKVRSRLHVPVNSWVLLAAGHSNGCFFGISCADISLIQRY